ncbi:hypothetical protein EYF80_054926 [Liparis tanakae]|uniref:Uncharacterized protein n=1 Tax=Liparis tanakae TaxID=230148 RepID=A0A4Z2F1R8_9TELE|nr:hypothetical protein EYF80_054926 [Liparis tanakae]
MALASTSKSWLSNRCAAGPSMTSRYSSSMKSMRKSLPMLLICRNTEQASRLRSTQDEKYWGQRAGSGVRDQGQRPGSEVRVGERNQGGSNIRQALADPESGHTCTSGKLQVRASPPHGPSGESRL